MKAVLLPIDGSECSLQAVRYLISAHEDGQRPVVHLLNAQPSITGHVSQFVSRSDIDGYRNEQSEQALRAARGMLDAAGVDYQVHTEVGHAAERIVHSADALRCDHIVMATHGRGALAELLVGSTTLRVLHQTHLPVVLVK
ncbi:MAG: universal stress protein [Caldimonas sp.]